MVNEKNTNWSLLTLWNVFYPMFIILSLIPIFVFLPIFYIMLEISIIELIILEVISILSSIIVIYICKRAKEEFNYHQRLILKKRNKDEVISQIEESLMLNNYQFEKKSNIGGLFPFPAIFEIYGKPIKIKVANQAYVTTISIGKWIPETEQDIINIMKILNF
jgi:hypothetical protein